jgi:hypothetical protein
MQFLKTNSRVDRIAFITFTVKPEFSSSLYAVSAFLKQDVYDIGVFE